MIEEGPFEGKIMCTDEMRAALRENGNEEKIPQLELLIAIHMLGGSATVLKRKTTDGFGKEISRFMVL